MSSALPLAVTLGEPAGIGPDIILLAWANRRSSLPPFVVIGDPAILRTRAKMLGLDIEIGGGPMQLAARWDGPTMTGVPGKPSQADNARVIGAIEGAVAMVRRGEASGVVTAPIAKSVLLAAGFAHAGHTEFLGELAERYWGIRRRPVMMLAGPQLRVVPVTIHIPLSQVAATLTTDRIVETGATVAAELASRFGIVRPRLRVSGLNPHAGDGGRIGREDETVIRPAVELLRQRGIEAAGPFAADTMFDPQARSQYDAALCMYHDQALIPAKMLDFDGTVNVTLGLPFVRTSPDHGTAFDIAGTGKARPESFIAALEMAATMVAREAETE